MTIALTSVRWKSQTFFNQLISLMIYRNKVGKFKKSLYTFPITLTLRKKLPCPDIFWSVLSRIWTDYGEIGVSIRIQSECGKIRTRKAPNTDTFHAVHFTYSVNQN